MNPIYNLFVKDESKIAAYFDTYAERMKQFEALLGDKAFFAGAKPSYGDVALYHVWDLTTEARGPTVPPTLRVLPGHAACPRAGRTGAGLAPGESACLTAAVAAGRRCGRRCWRWRRRR